jgi:hypothetical protein
MIAGVCSLHPRRMVLALGILGCTTLASASNVHKDLTARVQPASGPVSEVGEFRFIDNKDGTITDRSAQITWMRCMLGQRWSESLGRCSGNALILNRSEATEAIQRLNATESFYQDWRLPSLTELARIASKQPNLEGSRINGQDFPGTPPDFFWTGTARASGGYEPFWYAISFGQEGLKAVSAESKLFVRLVRQGN